MVYRKGMTTLQERADVGVSPHRVVQSNSASLRMMATLTRIAR